MRKLSTGEPYAGKSHVRFGGRGEPVAHSDPYHRIFCELGDKSPIPANLISFGAITIAPYAG